MHEALPRLRRIARRTRRHVGDLRPPGATVLRWLQVGRRGEIRFGQPGYALDDQPPARVRVHPDVTVGDHVAVHLGPQGRLEIGAGAVIGSHVVIAADDLVRIGAGCHVGSYSVLVDTWSYGRAASGPVPPPPPAPVDLGPGSRLGVRVVVGPGVTVPAGEHVPTAAVLHRDVVAS